MVISHRRFVLGLIVLACLASASARGELMTPAFAVSAPLSSVSVHTFHACALWGGTAYCWGHNDAGQVGNGTTEANDPLGIVRRPVPVAGGYSFQAVATGLQHSCGLTTLGGVKCWGSNFNGELGTGTNVFSSVPVDVFGLANGVRAISAGYYATCALTIENAVKCWGLNTSGQLGNNSTTNSNVPVDVFGLSSGVSAISAGYFSACAVLSVGGVKCWGGNPYGVLGNDSTTDSHVPVDVSGIGNGLPSVSVAVTHACVLTTTGVKCWGENSYGQLGNDTTTTSLIPVSVSGLSDAVAVSAGGSHACALLSGGGIKCWGIDFWGELGDNNGGFTNFAQTPVNVLGLASASGISAGGQATCAALKRGAIKCWGHGGEGALGNNSAVGSSVPVNVSGLGVIQLEPISDFSGAGRSDPGIFRPRNQPNALWYSRPSGGGANFQILFGSNGDIPVPGDYDGDGLTDAVVWSPSNGLWYGPKTGAPSLVTQMFLGQNGDIPVPCDYDGDGATDPAIWRPSTGQWFGVRANGGSIVLSTFFGLPGDTPVPADYDGDGICDPAVFREGSGPDGAGLWYAPSPFYGSPPVFQVYAGSPGDIPVPADYDGDGKADAVVFRPSIGLWYGPRTGAATIVMQFIMGQNGDIPIPGDYDGNGAVDPAIYRPNTGLFYGTNAAGNTVVLNTNLGVMAGDIPTAQRPHYQAAYPYAFSARAKAGPGTTTSTPTATSVASRHTPQ